MNENKNIIIPKSITNQCSKVARGQVYFAKSQAFYRTPTEDTHKIKKTRPWVILSSVEYNSNDVLYLGVALTSKLYALIDDDYTVIITFDPSNEKYQLVKPDQIRLFDRYELGTYEFTISEDKLKEIDMRRFQIEGTGKKYIPDFDKLIEEYDRERLPYLEYAKETVLKDKNIVPINNMRYPETIEDDSSYIESAATTEPVEATPVITKPSNIKKTIDKRNIVISTETKNKVQNPFVMSFNNSEVKDIYNKKREIYDKEILKATRKGISNEELAKTLNVDISIIDDLKIISYKANPCRYGFDSDLNKFYLKGSDEDPNKDIRWKSMSKYTDDELLELICKYENTDTYSASVELGIDPRTWQTYRGTIKSRLGL